MDQATKKEVLRLFTYGLYAVTTGTMADVAAFTANWLSQVSFEPPLIAVSVENDSHSLPLVQSSGHFAVNVLGADQRELSGQLGKRYAHNPEKADGLAYAAGVTGCPMLLDSLGSVECTVEAQLSAGDSTLVLGRVVHVVSHRPGEPLTMRAAGFKHAG